MSIKYKSNITIHKSHTTITIDVASQLQKIKDFLKCLVCNNLPIKPLRILTCSHSFCDACIRTKIVCPTCKQSFTNDDLLENPYAERQIKCLFHIEDIIENQDVQIDNNKEIQDFPVELTTRLVVENPHVEEVSKSVELCSINLPNGFINTVYPKIIWQDYSNKIDVHTKKRNQVGETVLHKACISGKIDIVKNYINSFKNVNIPDNYNWTPLHEASKAGHLEIVKLLLEAGAVVNVPSMSYDTPLHFAVKHTHPKIVEQLMEYGAETQAKTYEGVTPLDLANDKLKQIIENTKRTKIIQPIIIFSPYNMEIVSSSNVSTKIVTTVNQNFGMKLTKTISEKTSFMIVASKICEVSLSTLTAILHGTWIVTVDWFTACSTNKEIIDPTKYEITGTVNYPNSHASKKSRICRQLLGPRLLHGCNFYVHGQKFQDESNNLTLTKQDVINLIIAGNGNILKRCPRPESISEKRYPFHTHGKLKQCAYYIVYLAQPLQPEYRFPEIHTLHVSWLLKCIQNYQISYL